MCTVELWQKKEVRQVGEVVTGTTPSTKKPEYYGDEYKLISPADLDNGKYVTTAHRMLSALGLVQCRVLPKDTVLVGCIGNVGKIGMIKDEKAATNQQINAVICNPDHDPHFVYYSLTYNRQWLEKAAVKTTVPILNKSNFERFYLDFPLFPEQRRIAHVLTTVQTAIEQQARLIALTRELKSTLMRKLFTEGLRGEKPKETEIGLVPESWDVVELGDYADFKNGINFSAGDKGTGILTIDVLNMYGEGCSVSLANLYRVKKEIDESYLLEEDDLLFVRSSLKREGVGWTSLFIPTIERVTFCGFIIRARLKEKNTFSPHFLTNYCRTDIARKSLVSGSGQVAITNINQGILRDLHVPRPSIEEQEEIASAIDTIDKKISLLLNKQEKLEELFRTLLHQLMTGQVRVEDLDLDL